MSARFAWCIAVALLFLAACAQVLGLGDYGESHTVDPADATRPAEAADDESAADNAPDQSLAVDARRDAADDFRADAGMLTDREEPADAPPDTSPIDATADETADGADTADAALDTTLDAATDVAVDEQASDAPADTQLVCPAACNGGCGPRGATCIILVTSASGLPVLCPAGLPCEVHCNGTHVCTQAITCATGQPCHVVCEGDEACSSGLITGIVATSLCVECIASDPSHNPGCNSVTCTGTCTIHCDGGCGGSCANCTTVSACP
jgi:hypothetical protein